MRSRPTADAEAMKFRAPTLEEAIAAAEDALGGKVKVVEANRIRRGGIGGFFSTDLGVEVSIVPEDETIDEALERLVAESEADERQQWQRRVRTTARDDAAALSPSPVTLDPDMLVPEPSEPEISMQALRAMATLPVEEQPFAPRATRRLKPSTEMVSATDIVAELRQLAEPLAAATAPATVASPGAAPSSAPSSAHAPVTSTFDIVQRAADVAIAGRAAAAPAVDAPATDAPATDAPARRPAKLASPAATPRQDATPRPVATPTPAPVPAPAATVPAAAIVAERIVRGDDGPAVISTEAVVDAARRTSSDLVRANDVPATDVDIVPIRRSTAAPSRRHVELTIAAADQLIDSLSRSGSAQRLSVRVVLRSGDQREVEAEAHWEAQPSAAERRTVTEVA